MVTQGGRDKDFSLLKLSPDVNSRAAAGKSRYPGGLSEDYVTESLDPQSDSPFGFRNTSPTEIFRTFRKFCTFEYGEYDRSKRKIHMLFYCSLM